MHNKKTFLFSFFTDCRNLFLQQSNFLGTSGLNWENPSERGNSTADAPEYDKDAVTEGFAFGSYRTYSPAVGLNCTQNLGEKKDFEGYLNVINAIKKENQYLMLALLDYKQVPFYINGNKNETHLVCLKPMEERFYSFKLDNLSAGSHISCSCFF